MKSKNSGLLPEHLPKCPADFLSHTWLGTDYGVAPIVLVLCTLFLVPCILRLASCILHLASSVLVPGMVVAANEGSEEAEIRLRTAISSLLFRSEMAVVLLCPPSRIRGVTTWINMHDANIRSNSGLAAGPSRFMYACARFVVCYGVHHRVVVDSLDSSSAECRV